MKKLLTFSTFLIFTNISIAANKQYTDVLPAQPTQTGDKIEIVEIFWYACPHCHKFESHIEAWLESKPADVELRRMPGIFNENWIPHAKAYYTAEALGILGTIHNSLFNAIHNEKKKIHDDAAMEKFFVSQGVDKKEFAKIYHSDDILKKVKQAFLMGKNHYKITGVPTIIVNGKYMVSGSTAGSFENMLKVVDKLINKERATISEEG